MYAVALENTEGVFKYMMLPFEPGAVIEIEWMAVPASLKLADCRRGKVYFTRVDEVVENDGVACTVYKQLPSRP